MQSSGNSSGGKRADVAGGISLEDYIYIEAKEKCYEIEVQSLKEFQKAKDAIVERERSVIKDSFDARYRTKEIEAKIRNSSAINDSRFKKMTERNKDVLRILHHAQLELFDRITKDKEYYKKILHNLLIQGLIRLMEKEVRVRCLKRDQEIVESLLPKVRTDFHALVKKELERDDFWVDLKMDPTHTLEVRTIPSADDSQIAEHESQVNILKEEDHKKW